MPGERLLEPTDDPRDPASNVVAAAVVLVLGGAIGSILFVLWLTLR